MSRLYQLHKSGWILGCLACLLTMAGCEPTPHYELNNVTIASHSLVISSGFIEQLFSTDKDAYYLIGIEPVRENYNPSDPTNQKQFMTLALDSAHAEYLTWRRQILTDGEFNVATFASHALQYGETDYYFTGLKPGTDYWIYAFVVDPERLTPKGKLHLVTVRTATQSTVDAHFEYRIKGEWDYIYPMDSKGHIQAHFPYLMVCLDSVDLAEHFASPQAFFNHYVEVFLQYPKYADLLYGVRACKNNGYDNYMLFEQDHTYYTCIAGFDGLICHPTIYKFRWEGEQTELYFKDTPETNLYNYSDRW